MNSPEHWQQEARRLLSVNPAHSFFAFGHYYLLLDNATECFNNFLRGVESVFSGSINKKQVTFTEEISILDNAIKLNSTLKDQIRQYLQIAACFAKGESDYESFLNNPEHSKTRKETFKPPVIIVAGGASRMDITNTESYRDYFMEMMQGFKGTVISGGTNSGIPGLVGEVKTEIQMHSKIDFELIGYLPKKLPDEVSKSESYDYFHETGSDHFSVAEVINYWHDIVRSGLSPSDVLLVGIDGGALSALEYRIALSLGAKVSVHANSGRAVADLIEDNFWKKHRNLIKLQQGQPGVWNNLNLL